jgi:hypothetical protein
MGLPIRGSYRHGPTTLHARDVQTRTPYVHSKNWHRFTLSLGPDCNRSASTRHLGLLLVPKPVGDRRSPLPRK